MKLNEKKDRKLFSYSGIVKHPKNLFKPYYTTKETMAVSYDQALNNFRNQIKREHGKSADSFTPVLDTNAIICLDDESELVDNNVCQICGTKLLDNGDCPKCNELDYPDYFEEKMINDKGSKSKNDCRANSVPVQVEENFINNLNKDILSIIKSNNIPSEYMTNGKCSKSSGYNLLKAYNDKDTKDIKLYVGCLSHKKDDKPINYITHMWVEVDDKVYATNETDNNRIAKDFLQIDKTKDLYSQVYNFLNKDSLREDYDYGYHAGDLGKSERREQQTGGRGTGHFGTGTYFVSSDAKIKGYNDYQYGKGEAPHHIVDFSSYNLYKPSNNTYGYKLHDTLKQLNNNYKFFAKYGKDYEYFINRNLTKDNSGNFEIKDLPEIVSHLNNILYDYEKIDLPNLDYNTIEQYEETLEDKLYDEYNELYKDDYSKKWDAINNELEKDEKIKALRELVKTVRESVESEFNWSTVDAYEDYSKLTDNLFSALEGRHSKEEIQNALNQVNQHLDDKHGDSLSTIFMKSLGYDGIDVRHLQDDGDWAGLDNTTYGSVIYDVKPETIVEDINDKTFTYDKDETGRDVFYIYSFDGDKVNVQPHRVNPNGDYSRRTWNDTHRLKPNQQKEYLDYLISVDREKLNKLLVDREREYDEPIKQLQQEIENAERVRNSYTENLQESKDKTFTFPNLQQAIDYYWKDRDVKPEKVSIKQLVDDNNLLDDNDLQSYHQRQWDNKKASEFSINQDKVNSMRTSEVPYAVRHKDGKLELGDGRHRTRALYNDGYEYVVLPVISEDLVESNQDKLYNIKSVYHGTPSENFDNFLKDTTIWFSEDVTYAWDYGKNLFICNLSAHNLLDIGNTDGYIRGLMPNTFSKESISIANKLDIAPKELLMYGAYDDLKIFEIVMTKKFRQLCINKGYDGIKTIEDGNVCYGVFYLDQVQVVDVDVDNEHWL